MSNNISKEEIAARIAELEKRIKEENNDSDDKKNVFDPNATDIDDDSYGLCLGGGGGKGAYQLGVYRALTEYGLIDKVTAISGTSIGAINAVLFACNSPDESEEAWRNIHFETVFDVDPDLMFNDKLGFMSRKEMLKLMDSYLDYNKLADDKPGGIKLYATIAECVPEGDRKAEYIELTGMNEEDIRNVILASSTLPVLYEPVTYKGRDYCDGGLADNIPVKSLYDAGYRHIIVCGLGSDSRKNISAYPDADIIEIYPSVHLGDLIDGTLNFSAESMRFRSLLGYKDTMRALRIHFEKNPAYIAEADKYRDIDLADIKTELAMENADNNIKGTMGDVSRILSKLGIDQ